MAASKYLLRFDDICPTMNWAVWDVVEGVLERHGVRPILAVVPDNQDAGLRLNPPAPDFWERVRRWQSRGYTIALHGYQHLYVNQERGLMRLTPHSEFTGLPYEEQLDKLRKGLAVFTEHGVRADAFVAPSHSFDQNTLRVLEELGLRTVSDGLWPWPHGGGNGDLFWLPQQLWWFSRKSAGVWTVCLQHNSWSPERLNAFVREMEHYGPLMTDVESVRAEFAGRPLTFPDRFWALANLLWRHRILQVLYRLRNRLRSVGQRA
jgi:peptidoglycan/xylan/chitin deacetylase (PgdA/CDA1 family)